ncbi:hypothetical protein LCGC14_1463000 [marine sediment metagenome]|uniref:Uncharacterized protein n=1 Tax=marine sediment metagenome TaxID=412755 RepID=A0A0F9MGH9_9ZZZZ
MTYEILAFVGLVAAALMGGLWWGERGRRVSAERWITTGAPDKVEATTMVPSRDAEDRFEQASGEATDEMIERGMKELKADADLAGVEVNDEQLRKEVVQMLAGDDVLAE